MAMLLSSATTNSPSHKLHIEAVQTVVPTNPTEPRQSSAVNLIVPPQNNDDNNMISSKMFLQRRFNIVLCYKKDYEGCYSGWIMGGRIKESLGRALVEQPLLAGRVRAGAGDSLEIVGNDSGIRLVEGKADLKLGDHKREARDDVELVFWEDVVDHLSPLFYVQVTNFSCGGYSIGISCSLLLANPFSLTHFLKRWAHIHSTMFPIRTNHDDVIQIPTFYYLPNLANPKPPLSLLTKTANNVAPAKTAILTIPPRSIPDLDKNLASLCIGEAEKKTGYKMASNLSLLHNVPFEGVKVEMCSREGLLESSCSGNIDISCVRTMWEDEELGLEGLCFVEGKKPDYVSCWINSVVDQGSVVMINVPSGDDGDGNCNAGIKIVVTFD